MPYFGILQICDNISEEILWNVIQCNCLPILLHDIDSIHLRAAQVQKLFVAYNTVIRRCSVGNVLYYWGTLLVKLLLEERRLILVKSCIFYPGLLGLCGFLSMNEDDFIDVCYMYDVHCNLPKYIIKNNIRSHFLDVLRNNGLV